MYKAGTDCFFFCGSTRPVLGRTRGSRKKLMFSENFLFTREGISAVHTNKYFVQRDVTQTAMSCFMPKILFQKRRVLMRSWVLCCSIVTSLAVGAPQHAVGQVLYDDFNAANHLIEINK
jgi:hypothetical protein